MTLYKGLTTLNYLAYLLKLKKKKKREKKLLFSTINIHKYMIAISLLVGDSTGFDSHGTVYPAQKNDYELAVVEKLSEMSKYMKIVENTYGKFGCEQLLIKSSNFMLSIYFLKNSYLLQHT